MSHRLLSILLPLRDALWEGRRTVLLVVLVAAVAFGLLTPVQALSDSGSGTGPRLLLAPIPQVGALLSWSKEAQTAAATQARALQDLLVALLALGWTAMAMAGTTILIRYIIRAQQRGADIGVRRAVGASRRDVALALAAEAGLTSVLALMIGGVFAWATYRVAVSTWPGEAQPGALVFAGGVAALVTVIWVGILISMGFLSSQQMLNPDEGQVNLQIPALQLGISLAVVLTSTVLLDRGRGTQPTPGGTRGSGIVVQLDSGLTEPAVRAEKFGVLLSRVGREVDHSRVSLSGPGTLMGLGTVDVLTTDCGQCYVGGIYLRYKTVNAVHQFVSPDTFEAKGLRLAGGRGFTSRDSWGAPRVAVVNRHLALRHFQQGQAVGRSIFLGDGWPGRPYTVIGIVDDSPSRVIGGGLQPFETVYLSVLQFPPPTVDLLVRTEQPLESDHLLSLARQTLSPQARASVPQAEWELHAAQNLPVSWIGAWFGGAGLIVFLIAIGGTFGTVALWVRSLASELALRRALGARRAAIMRFVMGRAAGIGLGGSALGLFLFLVVLRQSLVSSLYGLRSWQPRVFLLVSGTLISVALIAAFLPTLRLIRRTISGSMTP
jgi:putative ABC transport system permease protein